MKCPKCGEEMKLISDNINDGSAFTCEKCSYSTWVHHSYKSNNSSEDNINIKPIIKRYKTSFSKEFQESLVDFFKSNLFIQPYRSVDKEKMGIKIYLCNEEIASVKLSSD